MKRIWLTLGAVALLAGCGSVTRLRPKQGMGDVPKAANAEKRETAAELMTPSTQAQPERQADLLTKSVERKEDPFDLPPVSHNGKKKPD